MNAATTAIGLARASPSAFDRKRKWRIIANALRLNVDDPVGFLTDSRQALSLTFAGVADRNRIDGRTDNVPITGCARMLDLG